MGPLLIVPEMVLSLTAIVKALSWMKWVEKDLFAQEQEWVLLVSLVFPLGDKPRRADLAVQSEKNFARKNMYV
jgi:hypothetical protein